MTPVELGQAIIAAYESQDWDTYRQLENRYASAGVVSLTLTRDYVTLALANVDMAIKADPASEPNLSFVRWVLTRYQTSMTAEPAIVSVETHLSPADEYKIRAAINGML